ncbi:MAG: Coenzyme F420 hydrogenase/dehydrogenase, beta subunit C-terminal domain [Collinsella sp.]
MNAVKAKRVGDAKCLLSYQSHDGKGLTRSSSGGLGADLAGLFAERGYRVFGCIYDSEKDAALTTEVDSLALDKLRGSKYIQSRSAEALATASAPGAGKIVFFGTPCQIAGLDSVLRRKGTRDEAVLVDLICHGVPSGLLWTRYLADRESEGVGEHPDVYFRWNANGWSPLKMMMMTSPSKDYSAVESEDDFYAFFNPGLCCAKSCYECPYRERSAADVRMGDYWGGRFAGDQKGVSMAIVMTDTGAKIMQELVAREPSPSSSISGNTGIANFPTTKASP